jgi:hypothetical protein
MYSLTRDRPDVGLGVVHHAGPVPVRIQPCDRELHQVMGPMPVLAEQVSHSALRGHPCRHELGELGIPGRPQHRALAFGRWAFMPS